MKAKTFRIVTLGCKVNQYESQWLRERLRERGYAETPGKAGVCIVNTCTVTGKSDRKSRDLLREMLEENAGAVVVVTGCYAERGREEIAARGDRVVVLGNRDKEKIPDLLEGMADPGRTAEISRMDESEQDRIRPASGISFFQGHDRAFVKIQDGCDHFCSYCIVPHVRGGPRSRPVPEILAEARRLSAAGIREIVLTGINVGSFDAGDGRGLPSLLDRLEEIGDIGRIRLSSIEPVYVTDELLDQMAASSRLCRHLAVPLQSGDDEILRRMNRHYLAADYVRLVERIRGRIPEIALTTDCLVGFPGESGENFRRTLDVVEKTAPARVHIFPYSRRPGTPAAESGGELPPTVIRERYQRLQELARRIARDYRRRFVGATREVLVESRRDKKTGLLAGYTDNYLRAVFPGNDDLMRRLVPVRITGADGEGLQGEVERKEN